MDRRRGRSVSPRDQPTIQAAGDTFSTFTPWDRKTRAEHVDDVRELMKTWRGGMWRTRSSRAL
ncbi:MAG: hypothetical protein U0746_15230 [Gemmataceae bacterium]